MLGWILYCAHSPPSHLIRHSLMARGQSKKPDRDLSTDNSNPSSRHCLEKGVIIVVSWTFPCGDGTDVPEKRTVHRMRSRPISACE